MGETVVKIKVSSLTNEKVKVVEVKALVNTGATYTAIPEKILEKLDVKRTGKVNIEFANGEVEERNIGGVWIEVEGRKNDKPGTFC